MSVSEGSVSYVNYHLDGDRILACVQLGLYLISDGDAHLIVLVSGPIENTQRAKPKIEVVAPRAEDAKASLAELLETMQRLNVYRGHVISLSPGQFGPGPKSVVAFHTVPSIARDAVVLPSGLLERIERHTVVFSRHAERLRAAGRSLKRGLLLHGSPGVGKTLTVEYLIGQMPGRTVLLTTGAGMGLLGPVMQLARSLAPAMVVLEDVDLIAEARGHFGSLSPLLFELLNQMDGLQSDCDVIFILTTNRPDVLEPALAARPGRIDLSLEFPLPDAAGRRHLLALYARGLSLYGVDIDALAERITGATPAFIKELLRQAAVLAAMDGDEITITRAHIETALEEINQGGRATERLLGFHASDDAESGTPFPVR